MGYSCQYKHTHCFGQSPRCSLVPTECKHVQPFESECFFIIFIGVIHLKRAQRSSRLECIVYCFGWSPVLCWSVLVEHVDPLLTSPLAFPGIPLHLSLWFLVLSCPFTSHVPNWFQMRRLFIHTSVPSPCPSIHPWFLPLIFLTWEIPY